MTTVKSRPAPSETDRSWSPDDSAALYQIAGWGKGYFDVNREGHVVVRPDPEGTPEIDLYEVVRGLRDRGLTSPVLLRFSDILRHRLKHLHDAFHRAIRENEYRGSYVGVYPIKVNQQRQVVSEVSRFGEPYGFGLEVGSKPELLAVMAMSRLDPKRLIVCNGFKDDRYIEAVILATKLGRNIVPVVEGFNELRLIIKHAQQYAVRPRIGVRIKLASQGAGRWRESAGAMSKFGLFVSEVLEMLELLQRHDMQDCLELVHCHLGSQIEDIHAIKDAVNELSHVYVELVRMGAGLRSIDIGGGLGVDYDGSRGGSDGSINYSLEEYASDIVYRIGAICSEAGIDHPTIISESGRAMVAYSSVLVFDVLGSTGTNRASISNETIAEVRTRTGLPQPIRDLVEAFENISVDRLVECYHDVMQARDDALHLFNLGCLSLTDRGLAERIFWATCARVYDLCRRDGARSEEFSELETILSETYFCNFSLFQSLPDSWAIDQVFPIIPIHRLDEQPTRNAIIADITCDSDGKVDHFIGNRDIKSTLPLHPLIANEEYYIGAFLIGAYQETLGDLHNLFGDTHVVHIRLDERSGWWIDDVIRGDTVRDVLGYVQYDTDRLYPMMAEDCEHAVRNGRMTVPETQVLLKFYESGLSGYTYLEPE